MSFSSAIIRDNIDRSIIWSKENYIYYERTRQLLSNPAIKDILRKMDLRKPYSVSRWVMIFMCAASPSPDFGNILRNDFGKLYYTRDTKGARSTIDLTTSPFFSNDSCSHPIVHFGLKDGRWTPLDLATGISHGLEKPEEYYNKETGEAYYDRYIVEDGNVVSNKRNISIKYARTSLQRALSNHMAMIEPDETGVPVNAVGSTRVMQPDVDNIDKDIAELEYMVSKHARVTVAEAINTYTGAPTDEIFHLTNQKCLGSKYPVTSDNFVTGEVGYMNFDVFLPETDIKPDPVVRQFKPDDVGAPSTYNTALKIFVNPEHQIKQNETLKKKAMRAQVDAANRTDKGKPRKPKLFTTKLTRILEVDENGKCVKSEPITDLTPWINCSFKKWTIRGYVIAELYKVSTAKEPLWCPRWRATELFLFDPIVKSSSSDVAPDTTDACDDDPSLLMLAAAPVLGIENAKETPTTESTDPKNGATTAGAAPHEQDEGWSELSTRAQSAKRTAEEAGINNGRFEILPDDDDEEEREAKKRFNLGNVPNTL